MASLRAPPPHRSPTGDTLVLPEVAALTRVLSFLGVSEADPPFVPRGINALCSERREQPTHLLRLGVSLGHRDDDAATLPEGILVDVELVRRQPMRERGRRSCLPALPGPRPGRRDLRPLSSVSSPASTCWCWTIGPSAPCRTPSAATSSRSSRTTPAPARPSSPASCRRSGGTTAWRTGPGRRHLRSAPHNAIESFYEDPHWRKEEKLDSQPTDAQRRSAPITIPDRRVHYGAIWMFTMAGIRIRTSSGPGQSPRPLRGPLPSAATGRPGAGHPARE